MERYSHRTKCVTHHVKRLPRVSWSFEWGMTVYTAVSGTGNSFQPAQTFFSLVCIPFSSPSQCGRAVRSEPDFDTKPPTLFAWRQPLGVWRIIFICVRRYLFALQVKQDLAQGRLTCNDTSAALLISHIVQCKSCWFLDEVALAVTVIRSMGENNHIHEKQ